jgi:hypothetical protein
MESGTTSLSWRLVTMATTEVKELGDFVVFDPR